MLISELSKELKVTEKFLLKKLKTLKLKAKDGGLTKIVEIVLRDALAKQGIGEAVKDEEDEAPKKKIVKKKAVKAVEASKTAPKKVPKKLAPPIKAVVAPVAVKQAPKAEPPKPPQPVVPPPPVPQSRPKVDVSKIEIPKEVYQFDPLKKKTMRFDQPFVTVKPLAKKRKRSPEGGFGAFGSRSSKPSASIAGAVVEEAVHAGPLRDIEVPFPITVKDFAVKIDQKTNVVLKKLLDMGIFASINQFLNEETIHKIAGSFGYNVLRVKSKEEQLIDVHEHQKDDPASLKPRPPVVTFMGHVDHGKTSLLDRIRSSRVAEGEHGGITQHIGAYSVDTPNGRITFLDTPGHEAFTAMRARGAHITDLVVLVVAADEGVMPQTEEAINHARAAGAPIIVALNKIDRKDADQDRVKKQLAVHDLSSEDWGGKVGVVGVSAVTGEGIDALLERILLEAEILELKANPAKKASGIVIDAHLSRGKGTMAALIVQSGTLKEGDAVVVGPYAGRVKALFDGHGRPIKEAGPSTPIEILGLSEVPAAGDIFYAVEDEKQARDIAAVRQEKIKHEKLAGTAKVSLEELYSQIQQGDIKELRVVIKGDVQGSIEALKESLAKIPTNEVKLRFMHAAVGDVNTSDVILAVASQAIIIAFHVKIDPKAKEELEKTPVDLREYRIIYDAVDDVRKALEGLLAPKLKRHFVGRVEIRNVFKLSRSGVVAGCYVQKGKVRNKSQVDVLRNGEVAHTGHISTLKRFKDDVKEVTEGFECGITVANFDQIQVGDVIEAFEVESIARKL